jgi:hypothetical protein
MRFKQGKAMNDQLNKWLVQSQASFNPGQFPNIHIDELAPEIFFGPPSSRE